MNRVNMLGCIVGLLGFSTLTSAALPTSSTGVTGGGNIGSNSPDAPSNVHDSNQTTPASSGNGHTLGPAATHGAPTAPDTIIDNAKPNDVPANADLTTRTQTDNPSAKIIFGRVESVNKDKQSIRVRDHQGLITDMKLNQNAMYGKKGSASKASTFSDIKTGDQLNYSIGSDGQINQLNWGSNKAQ